MLSMNLTAKRKQTEIACVQKKSYWKLVIIVWTESIRNIFAHEFQT